VEEGGANERSHDGLDGPLVGAAFFHALKDAVMPLTEFWRLLLGLAIIATVRRRA
jgi:hypothetical protein